MFLFGSSFCVFSLSSFRSVLLSVLFFIYMYLCFLCFLSVSFPAFSSFFFWALMSIMSVSNVLCVLSLFLSSFVFSLNLSHYLSHFIFISVSLCSPCLSIRNENRQPKLKNRGATIDKELNFRNTCSKFTNSPLRNQEFI